MSDVLPLLFSKLAMALCSLLGTEVSSGKQTKPLLSQYRLESSPWSMSLSVRPRGGTATNTSIKGSFDFSFVGCREPSLSLAAISASRRDAVALAPRRGMVSSWEAMNGFPPRK